MLGQGLASAARFKAAHEILIKQSDASSCTAFPQNSLFWVQAESRSSRFLQLRSRWLQQYLCLEGSVSVSLVKAAAKGSRERAPDSGCLPCSFSSLQLYWGACKRSSGDVGLCVSAGGCTWAGGVLCRLAAGKDTGT